MENNQHPQRCVDALDPGSHTLVPRRLGEREFNRCSNQGEFLREPSFMMGSEKFRFYSVMMECFGGIFSRPPRQGWM